MEARTPFDRGRLAVQRHAPKVPEGFSSGSQGHSIGPEGFSSGSQGRSKGALAKAVKVAETSRVEALAWKEKAEDEPY